MQYFKHMTSMRNDLKIKRVISKYGIEGYGVYNLILEMIVENISTENPLPKLEETCEDIAEFYNGNTAKINEIVCFCINQGLFEIDEIDGKVLCKKIYKFLEQSQTRSEQIRKLITSYKTGKHEQIVDISVDNFVDNLDKTDKIDDIVVYRPSQTNMKEQEQEQEQEQEKNKKSKFVPPTKQQIQQYVTEKDLNVDVDFFYNYFTAGNWYDSNNNKVKNWKQKLITWHNHNHTKKQDYNQIPDQAEIERQRKKYVDKN